jgi:hypothetical protein
MRTPDERMLRWAPQINVIRLGLSELLIELHEEGSVVARLDAISTALQYLDAAEQMLRAAAEREEETYARPE